MGRPLESRLLSVDAISVALSRDFSRFVAVIPFYRWLDTFMLISKESFVSRFMIGILILIFAYNLCSNKHDHRRGLDLILIIEQI